MIVLIESGVRMMLESKSAYFHLPQLVNVHTALFVAVKNSTVQYYQELSSILFLF